MCIRAGEAAAAFLARGDIVDVMLLDIRMPGKTGLDAVRETKSLPNYPIVAMTGHVDPDAQQEFRYAVVPLIVHRRTA